MSPPLARAFARIASTLFAFAVLVLIGFATSPASFATSGPPASLLVQQDAMAGAETAADLSAEQDESSSPDATLPDVWQIAARQQTAWAVAGTRLGADANGPGPDRPPPRPRSDLRSGSLGML